jgi:hypothetical protein
MGLLDEAIRDHLELKRRRGADPSEIAREEQEALEPVFPPEDGAAEGSGAAEGAEAALLDYEPEPLAQGPAPVEPTAPATVAQDTAEIDMRTVLEEDGAAQAASIAELAAEEELLEWEAPTRAGHEEALAAPEGTPPRDGLDGTVADEHEQIPGQESIAFE